MVPFKQITTEMLNNSAVVETEKYLNSNPSCCVTKSDELQEKILNLTAGDDLDQDTSLSLAAEVGIALLTENTLLKQQLHSLLEKKTC